MGQLSLTIQSLWLHSQLLNEFSYVLRQLNIVPFANRSTAHKNYSISKIIEHRLYAEFKYMQTHHRVSWRFHAFIIKIPHFNQPMMSGKKNDLPIRCAHIQKPLPQFSAMIWKKINLKKKWNDPGERTIDKRFYIARTQTTHIIGYSMKGRRTTTTHKKVFILMTKH